MKTNSRVHRHKRVRVKVNGTASIPRLSVFRSNKGIYVQVIDDENSVTLFAMKDTVLKSKGTKLEKATELGERFGKEILNKKITAVVFDRGGYKYHGRVKAFADGVREAGIKF